MKRNAFSPFDEGASSGITYVPAIDGACAGGGRRIAHDVWRGNCIVRAGLAVLRDGGAGQLPVLQLGVDGRQVVLDVQRELAVLERGAGRAVIGRKPS